MRLLLVGLSGALVLAIRIIYNKNRLIEELRAALYPFTKETKTASNYPLWNKYEAASRVYRRSRGK